MYISASIYSNKEEPLDAVVRELDEYNLDFFHIDCRDSTDVFDDVATIRSISATSIDMHIITAQPSKYFQKIREHKIEQVCFQLENIEEDIVFPPDLAGSVGLAILPTTPFVEIHKYRDQINYVLVMTTSPGESGGVFKKENFEYIRRIRQYFPQLQIQVDGGVNHEVSFVLRLLGVHGIVSGSYLLNHANMGAAMLQLKSRNVPSQFKVADFMIPLEELPVLSFEEMSLKKLLLKTEEYKLGCTFITQGEQLYGISTNADIRRGMIEDFEHFHEIDKRHFVNQNPLKIFETNTINEMLLTVKKVSFPVLLLPVVDELNKLKGAVIFNNLIKSE